MTEEELRREYESKLEAEKKRVQDAQAKMHEATQRLSDLERGFTTGHYYRAEELQGIGERDPNFAAKMAEFMKMRNASAAEEAESDDIGDVVDDEVFDVTSKAHEEWKERLARQRLSQMAEQRVARTVEKYLKKPDDSWRKEQEERIGRIEQASNDAMRWSQWVAQQYAEQQISGNDQLKVQNDLYRRMTSGDADERQKVWSEVAQVYQSWKSKSNTTDAYSDSSGLARIHSATEQPSHAPAPGQGQSPYRSSATALEEALAAAKDLYGV